MVMTPCGVAAPTYGWDSPVAQVGIGSGLGKPDGLLLQGSRTTCLSPSGPLGSLGAESSWRSLPNGFLLPASSQDSSSIFFCSVLPLGPRGKG